MMKYSNSLEFAKVRNYLADLCHSDGARLLAQKLHPICDKAEIENRLKLSSEIQQMQKNKIYYNFSLVSEIRSLLYENDGQIYDFEEFRLIVNNLIVVENISSDRKRYEIYPLFSAVADELVSQPELLERFRRIYNEDGEIRDNASSHLYSVRKRQKQVRRNIVTELQKKLSEYSEHSYLYDDVVTQRDGRFVVPVKKSASSYVNGIVHGESGSHNSVYIEPSEVVGLNNEVHLLEDEERQEIYKILREFTNQILAEKQNITYNTTILSKLDYYSAVASWANRLQGKVPQICENACLSIIKARHPLLIESFSSVERVIPFDLELGNEYDILLISGPNTGGKTITLKTVGLLTLMALSGLPIPASDESKIGIFGAVYADIGDNQSLENSLSTFSSHIANLKEMLESEEKNILVLIDEIGSATDPEQGSALAQVVLEHLSRKGVLGVVTTHYTALKVFAEGDERCVNAAMQFDTENHVPTYQFKIGLPGNSFAIEVASRLGMPGEIIDRARELAGRQNVELTDLIKKLDGERKRLSREIYQYELKTTLLNQKVDEYQRQISKIEQETRQIKKRSNLEAREFLTSLQKELNTEIDHIKRDEKQRRRQNLEDSLKKVVKLNNDLDEIAIEGSFRGRYKLQDPAIGQRVWLQDLDAEGVIVEISRNAIKIDLDGMYYTTNLKNLYKSDKEQPEKSDVHYSSPTPQAKFELKLLGYRYEEAVPEVDRLIDEALLSGLNYVRIVHGKGTGALRSKIRNYLRKNKFVEEFFTPAPEAGGDGVTVCKLHTE
jgi:DNA mismatch repair protein MutS2